MPGLSVKGIFSPEIKVNRVSPPYVNRAHSSLSIYDILQVPGTTAKWEYSISRFMFGSISSGHTVQNSNSLRILIRI